MRSDGRQPDQLRPLTFERRYTRQAPGSVLVRMGRTTVLCTCTVELAVLPFLVGSGKVWLTAEYGMLPGSTRTTPCPKHLKELAGAEGAVEEETLDDFLHAVPPEDRPRCRSGEGAGWPRTSSRGGARGQRQVAGLVDGVDTELWLAGPAPARLVAQQAGEDGPPLLSGTAFGPAALTGR